MSYLVDTNVLSEFAKKVPDLQVVKWLQHHESQLYTSVVSIAEICRGIERLPDGKKKELLRFWLESLCDSMQGRILHFNLGTARIWGQLKGALEKQGFTISSLDAQIAATAQQHQLILVTRNTKDFSKTRVQLLNPFSDS